MSAPARRISGREAASLTLLAVLLSVYFTWPMAARLGGVGRLELGDGQFSVWNVAWVAHALTTPGVNLFDANIFHPHPGTLAYSEPNLGAGALAVPAWLLTGNPYAAHNSAVLIALALSVIGMYLLVRHLTGSPEASLVAAIVFAYCPFFFARTAHIQLMMMAPLPYALLAFHRFADRTTWQRAIVLGLALGIQAQFCSYYGVLAGLLVGLGVLVFACEGGRWRQPAWWALAVLAAVVSGLTVLPVLPRYLELQAETGFGRPLEESIRYSADWRAYFASSALAHRWMLPYLGRWNEVLFPGFTALALGSAGLVVSVRRQASGAVAPLGRTTTIFYVLIFVLTLWSSFGPDAGLYSLLYHTVPVFSLLRAPARFGLAVTFALAVFVGAAITMLLARASTARRRWVAGGIALFAVAELTTPIPFLPARDVPRAYKVLAAAERGAVVEFPFFHGPQDRFRHTLYMLGSTAHWQPLINGYSDFIPANFVEGAPLLQEFPNPEGFAWLRERGARYAVFHLGLYDGPSEAALLERIAKYSDHLRPRYVLGTVLLYEIVDWPDEAP